MNKKQNITNHNIPNIRDDIHFHLKRLSEIYITAGYDNDTIMKYLTYFIAGVGVNLREEDVFPHIDSARIRIQKLKTNLTAQIREWINLTKHNFSITDLYQDLTFITSKDRPTVTVILNRLIKEGLIERAGNKHGIYRRIENDVETIDFMNADVKTLPLWMPLGLSKMVNIMPGNIIVLAGSPNAGKTTFLLQCIAGNHKTMDVHYFNSEMGASELRKRLELFEHPLSQWRFTPYERSDNFEDVVKTGESSLNIIDFLEVHDNFYEVGGMLQRIHKKLKGATCIVALQKNKGTETGLGGYRSLEKPRLYLAMDYGTMKIVKAKNFADSNNNPNGQQIDFKIYNGCKFKVTRDWYREQ